MSFGRTRVQVHVPIHQNELEWSKFYSYWDGHYATSYWPPWGDLSRGESLCGDYTNPGPPYRSGGPLFIQKRSLVVDFGSYSALTYNYINPLLSLAVGKAVPPNPELLIGPLVPSGFDDGSWGDPSSSGATGWNKFKPGKPGASLAQFVGELRDVPRMFKFRVKEFKDLGSQYLNYQFGWRPFLMDLARFVRTTDSLQKRYQFFRNNNGKPMRRGGTVSKTSTTSTVACSLRPLIEISGYSMVEPQVSPDPVFTVVDSDHTWFEAKFRFWIPDFGTDESLSRLGNQMYGASLSPSLVWELMPWSWLIDWFANVGDVMSNLSESEAAENLVAEYAFIMRHRKRTVTYKGSYDYLSEKDVWDPSHDKLANAQASFTYTFETKQRQQASPYGFGLTWGDFSLRQLAILASLGISRSR